MSTLNFMGILIGVCSFLIIGLLHPVVIKAEYHCGTKVWPLFLIGGLICVILSMLMSSIFYSTILSVLGFSLFWSILELFEQKKRVEKGWFPKKENKK